MTDEDILKYKSACIRFAEKLNRFEPGLSEDFMQGVTAEIERRGDYIQACVDNGGIELILAFQWMTSPQGHEFWRRVCDISEVEGLFEPIEEE